MHCSIEVDMTPAFCMIFSFLVGAFTGGVVLMMRGIAVFDGDAFRKIEGMVLGDQGWGEACLQMVSNN